MRHRLWRWPWYPTAFLAAAILTLFVGIEASPSVVVLPPVMATLVAAVIVSSLSVEPAS
jgi:hypothetical protein